MTTPRALCAAILVVAFVPLPAAGQAPRRTPWGDPDLQGLWTNATITPFERTADMTGKPVLSEQEAAEFEKQTLQARDADNRTGGTEADLGRAYNQFWYDRGTKVVGTRRTSLVVDPPDGRVPSLTPEAQQRADARVAARRRSPADGPEDRSLAERCILWPTAGPPMLPSGYNNNYQILQAPGYVVILIEMIHDVAGHSAGRPSTCATEHSPVDGRLARPLGRHDAGRHHHEFHGQDEFSRDRAKTAARRAVHARRRRHTQLRVHGRDPSAFSRSWTAAIPMTKTEGPIFEYACHEGNYGMTNLLSGARAEESR